MGLIRDWLAGRMQNGGAQSGQQTGRRRIDLGERAGPFPVYAIGDVHGCLDELEAAEARIAADIAATGRDGVVILLGDYIDRGPASRQVLDHLIAPSALGLRRIALCGNHEDVFWRFIEQPEINTDWLALGGEQTLMSYGVDLHHLKSRARGSGIATVLAEAIPPSHRQFVADLPISLRFGGLFFVHAGIRPGIALEKQSDEDMLWIREPFLSRGPGLPLRVIHGHTPGPEIVFGPNRIGIDTGVFHTGRLGVIRIEGEEVTAL